MSNSFPTGSFGSGNHLDSMWQSMEQLRTKIERSVSGRVGRGEVRSAVLILLLEQPMHGYQIIREIDARSAGSWKPSAGSVYPTLQLLADEGLITSEEAGGRKTYTLTDDGREAAAALETPAQWNSDKTSRSGAFADISKAGFELAQAAAQVSRTGSEEQITESVRVIEEARRRLHLILAEDSPR